MSPPASDANDSAPIESDGVNYADADGRVTRLGLSRWACKGGRDRPVQRVFSQALPWAMLFGMFCRQPVYRPGEVYLLAGDEVVVTQAGKHTDGLDRFFASLYSQLVPALAVFALSWVSVQERRSCPSRVEPIVRSAAENAVSKAKAEAKQPPPSTTRRGPGRPKGRQTQATAAVTLTPEVVRIRHLRKALLHLIPPSILLPDLRRDGHCGHPNALHMASPCRVPRIAT
jgi:putative transposase